MKTAINKILVNPNLRVHIDTNHEIKIYQTERMCWVKTVRLILEESRTTCGVLCLAVTSFTASSQIKKVVTGSVLN